MRKDSSGNAFKQRGGLLVTLIIDKGGNHSGVTDPVTEAIDAEHITSLFAQAELTPQIGRYEFMIYEHGTTLVTAPSQSACALAPALEVVFDRELGQRLYGQAEAMSTSLLPSDVAQDGMHGQGLHGSLVS